VILSGVAATLCFNPWSAREFWRFQSSQRFFLAETLSRNGNESDRLFSGFLDSDRKSAGFFWGL